MIEPLLPDPRRSLYIGAHCDDPRGIGAKSLRGYAETFHCCETFHC